MTNNHRFQGQSGVVGANLAIVLAFALFAVICLTRTVVAASSIDDRVETINKEVVTVNVELDNVPKLDQTGADAEEILKAAKPLEQLAIDINTSAKSIDPVVVSILSNAQSINRTVASIRGNLSTLRPEVVSINNGVEAINHKADTIIRLLNAVKADTDAILGQVGTRGHGGDNIHSHAQSIDCKLAGPGCAA